MIKADDAIEIDTSTLSIAQVVDKIEAIVREKWPKA
jgi:cytidylate kinase